MQLDRPGDDRRERDHLLVGGSGGYDVVGGFGGVGGNIELADVECRGFDVGDCVGVVLVGVDGGHLLLRRSPVPIRFFQL